MRLSYARVSIGNNHFGDLPRCENDKWYIVKSKTGNPVAGDYVKVMSTCDSCLQI